MAPKKKPATTFAMRSVKGGILQSQNKGKGKAAAAAAQPRPPPRGLGQASGGKAAAAAPPSAAAPSAAPPQIDPAVAAAAENTLRAFDLNGKFGPCVNPTRLERWERAERLGLEPPQEVKELLEKFAAVAAAAGPRKKVGVSDKSLWNGRV